MNITELRSPGACGGPLPMSTPRKSNQGPTHLCVCDVHSRGMSVTYLYMTLCDDLPWSLIE
ncbi:hypothetical protein BD309DRAFT_975884 [Dichomitus squalens]|nr:hypothetical protein BD309DRAFT_975884 [Dichomitus squalens]